jgi:hypothetical protein
MQYLASLLLDAAVRLDLKASLDTTWGRSDDMFQETLKLLHFHDLLKLSRPFLKRSPVIGYRGQLGKKEEYRS